MEQRHHRSAAIKPTDGRVAGYAAVFNSPSHPLPGGRGQFIERIAPGAFDSAGEKRAVRLFFGHNDRGLPLASTGSGTMDIRQDDKGLYFAADLADTTEGRDVKTLLERGDIGGAGSVSFGFRVIEDEWNTTRTERTLKNVDLFEISIVSEAAYGASVSDLRHRPQHQRRLNVLRAILETKNEGF
mgnify:CR=1 FL=1